MHVITRAIMVESLTDEQTLGPSHQSRGEKNPLDEISCSLSLNYYKFQIDCNICIFLDVKNKKKSHKPAEKVSPSFARSEELYKDKALAK